MFRRPFKSRIQTTPPQRFELIVDDTIKIELVGERWEKSIFIINTPKKREEIPLPPLSFFFF